MKKGTRIVCVPGVIAAGILIWAACIRKTEIVWPAEMIAYSGYSAEEHLEEYLALPDRKLLFSRAAVSEDGSLVIYVTGLQRLYYRNRYSRMLREALADAGAMHMDAAVQDHYRTVIYYAESYERFFNATMAQMRVEAFASCLQAEQRRGRDPWELHIQIFRDQNSPDPLAEFTVPKETVSIRQELWE